MYHLVLWWLASGRPAFWSEVAAKDVVAWGLMLCGLLLSIWTIVYMKLRGKGNPMDAFGHEVAPRTQHLMTDGPYRLNRNLLSEERRLHRDFGNYMAS